MGLTQSSLIVPVSLRDYLLGRLYIVALRAFEKHMDPFVKETMRAKYPLNDLEKQSIAEFKTAEDDARQQLENLPASIETAEQDKESAKEAMSSATPADRNMLKQKIITADKTLRDLKKFKKDFEKTKQDRQKNFKQPPYVQQCQSAVSKSMKQFTTFDRHWDMFTHVEIISKYLPDVFADAIGCGPFDFEPKELFDKLRRAYWARTWRAHPEEYEKPREAQVLDFLGTMHSVLKLCGRGDGVEQVHVVLQRAQELMEKATVAVASPANKNSIPPHVFVTLSLDDFEHHILYVALCEFTERMQGLVGRFMFKDGNIRIPGAEAGKSTWSAEWQRRVKAKEVKTAFKSITFARNALFHHDEDKWKDANVSLELERMGQVLEWLHPGPQIAGSVPLIAKWGPCPADWNHHGRLDRAKSVAIPAPPVPVPNPVPTAEASAVTVSTTSAPPVTATGVAPAITRPTAAASPRLPTKQVHLRVHLQLSVGGMHLPIEPERNFVGREDKVTDLEKALMKDGARVLVHGIAGVGKDTLVAEVCRGDFVKTLPDMRVMAWLQGSTDAALRRQLIEHFLTHQRGVLHGHEKDPKACLKVIREWLSHNPGWFIIVEDGTEQCRALFECLPLDAPHGRVVVTSKERLDRDPNIVGVAGEFVLVIHAVLDCWTLDTNAYCARHLYCASIRTTIVYIYRHRRRGSSECGQHAGPASASARPNY